MLDYQLVQKEITGSDNVTRTFMYKKLSNSGMFYHAETDNKIIQVLENCRENRTRVLVDYGDIITGESWCETSDIMGYIGSSTGEFKIPLIVYNSRSLGGPSLLDNCIIKIQLSKGKQTLYQHNNYHKKPK